MGFEVIDEVSVDRRHGRVFEHGWQSWSPTTSYPAAARSYRPVEPAMDLMCYRPHKPAPAHGFQSEGLLVVDPGHGGQVRRYAAVDTTTSVPSIRASYLDGRLVVTADGPTTKSRHGSTTAVRPRSATGSRRPAGSARCRASSVASATPAAARGSGWRRSWWAPAARSPATIRTGWSAR